MDPARTVETDSSRLTGVAAAGWHRRSSNQTGIRPALPRRDFRPVLSGRLGYGDAPSAKRCEGSPGAWDAAVQELVDEGPGRARRRGQERTGPEEVVAIAAADGGVEAGARICVGSSVYGLAVIPEP